MDDQSLFTKDTFEPPQTAENAIVAIAYRHDLGLSGSHRSIPKLADELAKKHRDDYKSMGRELHDRECFQCWQAYSTPGIKMHTPDQVDEITDLYSGLIADVVEGRRKIVHVRGAA